MARKTNPELPLDVQLKNLQQQSTALGDRISTVNAGLLNQTQVGADSYFAKTNEQKLATQADLEYTAEYNKAYDPIKNTKFSLGQDIKGNSSNDSAFYVFNAAAEAEKIVDDKIKAIKQNNLDYAAQQQRIQNFVNTGAEKEKSAVLDSYLSSLINKQSSFANSTIQSNDSAFSMDTWKSTPWKNKTTTYQSSRVNGKTVVTPIYSYKISAEENQKRIDLFKQMETTKYNANLSIQQQAAQAHSDSLAAEKNKIEKEITKLQNKLNKPKK